MTGERLTREEVQRRAENYVDQLGVVRGNRQAARWWDPICPRVAGLSPPAAQKVEVRLREVAAAAGVPMSKPSSSCEKNIIISFTRDAGEVLRTVAARAPRQLAEVPPASRADLLNGKAPVRWYYSTEIRSKDGMRGMGTQPLWSPGDGGEKGGSAIPDNGKSVSFQQYSSSIISTLGIRALTGATVVIDGSLAKGKTLDALASYAALVALSEIRLADEKPQHSILTMFDRSEASPILTDFDVRFLKSLYTLPLDRKGRYHRGIIVRDIASNNP